MEIKTRGGEIESATGLAVLLVIVCICLYFGFAKRYEDVEANKEYQYIQAQVQEVFPHEFRNDDGDYDTHYAVLMSFYYGRDLVEVRTGTVFTTSKQVGDMLPILVKKVGDGDYDYSFAKKDWLTGEYVDKAKDYDAPIFIAGILLSFAMFPLGVLVKTQIMKKLCLVGAVVVLFGSSIFYAVTGGLAGVFFLLCLVIVVGIIWSAVHKINKMVGRVKRDGKSNIFDANARLLVVEEIYEGMEPEMDTVIFYLRANDEKARNYFSYDCKSGMFRRGEERCVDIRKLVAGTKRRQIDIYQMLDISQMLPEDFAKLGPEERQFIDKYVRWNG